MMDKSSPAFIEWRRRVVKLIDRYVAAEIDEAMEEGEGGDSSEAYEWLRQEIDAFPFPQNNTEEN